MLLQVIETALDRPYPIFKLYFIRKYQNSYPYLHCNIFSIYKNIFWEEIYNNVF